MKYRLKVDHSVECEAERVTISGQTRVVLLGLTSVLRGLWDYLETSYFDFNWEPVPEPAKSRKCQTLILGVPCTKDATIIASPCLGSLGKMEVCDDCWNLWQKHSNPDVGLVPTFICRINRAKPRKFRVKIPVHPTGNVGVVGWTECEAEEVVDG
jgi:hypothetical protein